MGGAWAGPPDPELTSETMIVKSSPCMGLLAAHDASQA